MKLFPLIVIAAALTAACSPEAKVASVDLCDIPKHGARWTDKEIVVAGWYYGSSHMAEIGSDKCRYDRLSPHFKEGTVGSFHDSTDKQQSELKADLKSGIWPEAQFYARFHGVLRFEPSQPSLWNDRTNYYELEIDRVDGIRWEEAPFLNPVPPCNAECQAYGRKMGATHPRSQRIKNGHID